MKLEIDENILGFTLIMYACNREVHKWTIKEVIELIQKVQEREKGSE